MSKLEDLRKYSHPKIHDGYSILKAFAEDCGRNMKANIFDDLKEIVAIVTGAQRVRDLHRPVQTSGVLGGVLHCAKCWTLAQHHPNIYTVFWPCDTIRALDGEQ